MNKKNSFILLILFIPFLFLSETSFSKTYYTWVDKYGVTHITENPEEIPRDRTGTIKKFESKGKFSFIEQNIRYLKANRHIFIKYLIYLIAAVVFFLVLKKIYRNIRAKRNLNRIKSRIEYINKSGVETLTAENMKDRVHLLLTIEGYKLAIPDSQFNTVVDYIGEKGGKRIAISINSSENLVSKMVINDLDREKYRYDCDKSMFICRTYFEEDVPEFAKQVECELIDKDRLSKMLIKSGI